MRPHRRRGPDEQAGNFCVYLLMFFFDCLGLCLFACLGGTKNGPHSRVRILKAGRIQQIEQEPGHTV